MRWKRWCLILACRLPVKRATLCCQSYWSPLSWTLLWVHGGSFKPCGCFLETETQHTRDSLPAEPFTVSTWLWTCSFIVIRKQASEVCLHSIWSLISIDIRYFQGPTRDLIVSSNTPLMKTDPEERTMSVLLQCGNNSYYQSPTSGQSCVMSDFDVFGFLQLLPAVKAATLKHW